MTTKQFTGTELYETAAFINGFQNGEIKLIGLINEAGLTEGTKRYLYRIYKLISAEIETLNKSRNELKDSDKAQEQKDQEDIELLKTTVSISFDPVSFHLIENLSFNVNYQYLYDKIFE